MRANVGVCPFSVAFRRVFAREEAKSAKKPLCDVNYCNENAAHKGLGYGKDQHEPLTIHTPVSCELLIVQTAFHGCACPNGT